MFFAMLIKKSYYATARDELEKNKDSRNELEWIGKNLYNPHQIPACLCNADEATGEKEYVMIWQEQKKKSDY